MKKHIIAAAVAAAVAVPVMAQVTVSGVIDATAHSQTSTTSSAVLGGAVTTTKTTGNLSAGEGDSWSTSQLVFTATEDLGGGLRATAVFSSRLGQVGDNIGSRDRHISLGGGFGTVRLGRFAGTIDGHNGFSGAGTTGTPGALNTFSTGGTGRFFTVDGNNAAGTGIGGSFERNNNHVAYSSPTISGFTVSAGFTNDETDNPTLLGATSAKMQYASLAYSQGPLTAMIATGDRKVSLEGTANVNQTSASADFDWVGLRYNFGVAVINAAYATRKDTGTTAVGVTGSTTDASVSALGIAVPFGALTFRASVYDGDDDRTVQATDNTELSGSQLSVTYSLSKRTMAYVAYGKNEVKQTSGATSTAVGIKVTMTNLGISHSF